MTRPQSTKTLLLALVMLLARAGGARAQPHGSTDSGSPGDGMIRAWLAARAERIENSFADDIHPPPDAERGSALRGEYLRMLGLDPLPERTPLEATITGTIAGDGFVVDSLHYQSIPGLYVTANLWRPPGTAAGTRHPAILYVCGHSGRGRDGNKTAFQDQGIWFARHGYVCLVVDTLQLGEIPGIHHGTYREGRWWWQSRGYTPAGVECWNGIRGIDLLAARDDVDPERIGVTGISGGGATTLWIAAADDRVAAAAPVSGMADLRGYVTERCIDGHCDCMFLVNTERWPWTRIAALVAPRPLLFVNSDTDPIFPMSANERVAAGLERVWAIHGVGDRFDAQVSIGGHAYRSDIRAGVYRFMNTWLKEDPRPVTDGDIDVVIEAEGHVVHPLPPERLRAFPTDADIPALARNGSIDRSFVPLGDPGMPGPGGFPAWRERLLRLLAREAFHGASDRSADPPRVDRDAGGEWRVETEPGIVCTLVPPTIDAAGRAARHLLVVRSHDDEVAPPAEDGEAVWMLDPRGVGAGRWTTRNPPNHVERSMALLGDTVAAGQLRDTLAAVAAIRAADVHERRPLRLAGRGKGALVAAYAAILAPSVEGVNLLAPPATHMADDAPAFLGILRVADVPHILGLLAPRDLVLHEVDAAPFADTSVIYERAGAAGRFRVEGAATGR